MHSAHSERISYIYRTCIYLYGWAVMLINLMDLKKNKTKLSAKPRMYEANTQIHTLVITTFMVHIIYALFLGYSFYFSSFVRFQIHLTGGVLNRKWSWKTFHLEEKEEKWIRYTRVLFRTTYTMSIMKWKWWARNENRKPRKNKHMFTLTHSYTSHSLWRKKKSMLLMAGRSLSLSLSRQFVCCFFFNFY